MDHPAIFISVSVLITTIAFIAIALLGQIA